MSEQHSTELWKPVEGFPGYEVSNQGRVKGPRKGIMKTGCNDARYPCVRLGRGSGLLRVHRLVVEAFIGPIPSDKVVNHINGIRDDARIENLEIVTPRENLIHSVRILKTRKPPLLLGEKAHFSKLNADQVTQIRELRGKMSGPKVAKQFGISFVAVYKIWNGESWKHHAVLPTSPVP